jgi:thiol-disulfide isomerase/thioredoxin
MKTWATVAVIFVLILASVPANAREVAPDFVAKTTGGQTYTSENLRRENILVEFWATWCHVCRDDQPALDRISREFSGRGLIVLAVEAYDTGDETRKYLAQNPRSCNVVLGEDTNLVAQFRPTSVPYYVLIDRSGEIAGTQDGGGGEEALLDLLGNVGSGGRSLGESCGEVSTPPVLRHSDPKLIEVPRGSFLAHPKPLTPAIFILTTGEKVESRHYTIAGATIRITDQPEVRTIPLTALDRKATLAANHKRGIDLKIPANSNDVYLGF